MRPVLLLLTLFAPAVAIAQTAPDPVAAEGRRTCEAKADSSGITGDNRATYLRECEAGERLKQGAQPR